MTALREAMLLEMRLPGLAASTVEAYIDTMERSARFAGGRRIR